MYTKGNIIRKPNIRKKKFMNILLHHTFCICIKILSACFAYYKTCMLKTHIGVKLNGNEKKKKNKTSRLMYHVLHVTATDPPRANSPILRSRLIPKDLILEKMYDANSHSNGNQQKKNLEVFQYQQYALRPEVSSTPGSRFFAIPHTQD